MKSYHEIIKKRERERKCAKLGEMKKKQKNMHIFNLMQEIIISTPNHCIKLQLELKLWFFRNHFQ